MAKAIQVRVSDSEYELIESKAKKFGISLSAYIRIVALNSEIKIVNELNNENE